MTMLKAKLFANGQSQAVRLPKSCRFDADEVVVKKLGDAVLLLPVQYDQDALFDLLAQIPASSLPDREQPQTNDQKTRQAVGR